MRICVIFNPAAGRRRAKRRLAGFLKRWEGRVTLRPTERAGHAAELAANAVAEGFDLVAAAGGDGTVHEVASGLLTAAEGAGRPAPSFAVVPIGSANDYAYSL
ncbi:MAG: diacylglycerol kinase family protein, partial [Planctomycetota bacterium]